MRRNLLVGLAFALLSAAQIASAQTVQVDRTNKTISVMATETVRVNPDLAVVDVGYRNYAKTKDSAFEDNVRVANRITKALLDAGIPKDKIESESLQLGDASRRWDENAPKEERIEAHQSWKVRVAAQDAQKVVDLVVAAGANEIDDVNWIVAHPLELEAKANSAALARARALAEKMAKESGVKVGDLLFLSNSLFPEDYRVVTVHAEPLAASVKLPTPKLALFPKQVERQATVRAIFALE